MNKRKIKYRYPGAQPFSTEQKQIFFGREKDVDNLYELLSLEKLVVLYSKSGLGKSSLINAGIIPKIETAADFQPLSIRFGAYTDEQNKTPIDTTSQQLVLNSTSNTYLNKLIPEDNSSWYFLKKRQEIENEEKGFLLIFDQFEELFTYSDIEINKFIEELKEILSNQIPQRFREALEKQFEENNLKLTERELELFHKEVEIKVLFAIRSDRMSLLNDLKDYLPNILRHCYELDALSIEQAEDAILNPAFKKDEAFICSNFDFEDESLDAILQFLTKNHTRKIESFQLQILCQNIEKKVIEKNISKISLSDIGNIESVYKNHYDNLIKNIGSETEQLAARKLIEEGLIFEEEERRLSLYEGQISKSFGVSPDLLQRLVDSHLLRAEPSMQGGYTYELCHDTIVAPVLDAKKKRFEEDERVKKEKEKEKTRIQKEELRKREVNKQLLEVERKGRKRAKRLSIIGFFLAGVAFVLAMSSFYFYMNATEQTHIANEALIKAKKQEIIADSLRIIAQEKVKIIREEKNEVEEQKSIVEFERQKAIDAGKELEKQLKENQILQEKNKQYEDLQRQLRLKRYQQIKN